MELRLFVITSLVAVVLVCRAFNVKIGYWRKGKWENGGIGYSIKNQNGTLSKIKLDVYKTKDEAIKFYNENKAKLRDRGVFI